MRILLLDADLRFINPTRTLWIRVLESIGPTTCFGPGYVAPEVLAVGVERFAERHGPFDVIVSTAHIACAGMFSPGQYRRNFITNGHPTDLPAQCRRIAMDRARVPGLHVASLLEVDYHYLTEWQVADLEPFALVVGLGPEFVRPLPPLEGTPPGFVAGYPLTNAWWAFFSAHPERIVSLPMCVSDTAFCATALAARPTAWSVPGVRYPERQAMRAILTARGIRTPARPRLGGLLTRLGGRPWTRPAFVAAYQTRFAQELRTSRYAYTTGSILRYPVLKYVEIPAAGCVLVCQPCHGFADLGFVDGENAISGEDPAALVDRVTPLAPATLQAIADAGRCLVGTTHTVAARAAQLERALTRAVAGTYRGSRWMAGQFRVTA